MLRSQFLLMFLLLGTGGCAFIDLNVEPPTNDVLAHSSNIGRGRNIVMNASFKDQRPYPSRCGMQKNGYNIDTADVHCTLPPPLWLSNALEQRLVSSGFHVIKSNDAEVESAIHIDGTVLQFFVEPEVGFATVTPEADISVKLVITSASGLRAERVFYVKGTEVSLMSTEDNFQKATDSATLQIVQSMVSAIVSLLDRYPQLGAPNSAVSAKVSSLSAPEASR